MDDLTAFERRLSDRLGRELAGSVRPFDPGSVASAAVGRRSRWDSLRNRLRIGPLPVSSAGRRVALVAVAALLCLATLWLVAGLAAPRDPGLGFIRTNGDVVITAPDGSGQQVIFHVERPVFFSQIEWAPDGRHLAIVDEGARLTVIDRAGRAISTRRLDDGRSMVAWSPDGQRLAISDGPWLPLDRSGPPLTHPRLEIVRPDGALLWAAPLPAEFRYVPQLSELAWSPDGRSLAITGSTYVGEYVDYPSSVWLVDTIARSVRDLTSGGAATYDYQPRWLPDGALAFARVDAGIMQVDPATNAVSMIFAIDRVPCDGDACVPARIGLHELSPDGMHLAVADQAEGVAVLDLRARTLTPVQTLRKGNARTPIGWTPDGTALLFAFAATRDGLPPSVIAVDVRTGGQRVLVTDAWSFDVLR